MPNAPVNLSSLLNRRKTVTFKYGEEDGQEGVEIQVTFNPKKYDAKAHRKLVALSEEKTFDGMVDLMLKLLVDWNLAGEDGKALPVTRDAVEELPIDLLLAMGGAIMGAVNNVAPNSETSRDT